MIVMPDDTAPPADLVQMQRELDALNAEQHHLAGLLPGPVEDRDPATQQRYQQVWNRRRELALAMHRHEHLNGPSYDRWLAVREAARADDTSA